MYRFTNAPQASADRARPLMDRLTIGEVNQSSDGSATARCLGSLPAKWRHLAIVGAEYMYHWYIQQCSTNSTRLNPACQIFCLAGIQLPWSISVPVTQHCWHVVTHQFSTLSDRHHAQYWATRMISRPISLRFPNATWCLCLNLNRKYVPFF